VVLKTLSKVERFQNDTVSLVMSMAKPHRFKNGLVRNWLAREVNMVNVAHKQLDLTIG